VNDAELLERLNRGDEAAFRYVVDTWQHMVYNTIVSIVQNEADAEDITQEVFVQVYRSVSSFKGEAKFSTWLYRIAVSKSLDFERKKKTKKRFSFLRMLPTDSDSAEAISDFQHPGVALEHKEGAARLFNLIHQLPEKQKAVIILQKVEGLSLEEMSQVLELSTGAVESLLYRARANLKALLEKNK
jgi:RNA polymerase sigma-70 factor (ECF subfamily)